MTCMPPACTHAWLTVPKNYTGIDSFQYTISDGNATSPGSVAVTVRPGRLQQRRLLTNTQTCPCLYRAPLAESKAAVVSPATA